MRRRVGVLLTHDVAVAAATDAANRQMQQAGRTAWSEEDYDLATREFNRLIPAVALRSVEPIEPAVC